MSVKRILILIASSIVALSTPSWAQTLELINPTTNTSTVTLAPGASFSLNIEILGPATTPALDSFDLTMSGSTSSTTALPAGITLTGFSNLQSSFFGGQGNAPNTNSYSAIALGADLAFSSTPTTILTANFTTSSTLSPGSYAIDFPPTGAFQGLYDVNGNSISYTPLDATINVDTATAPEPSTWASLLMGIGALALWVRGLKGRGPVNFKL